MIYKVVDIANQIFLTLNEASDLSIAMISFWVRNNLGKLNSLIYSCYDIDPITFEITPNMDNQDSAVYTKLYEIVYLDKKVLDSLGAAGTNTVLSVQSDGASVKIIDRNQLARTYILAKKEAMIELKQLLNAYRQSNYKILAVFGDDTTAAPLALPTTRFRSIFNS